tara:strand:+ start:1332 stop:2012 length:681 start_codon:yes stop_codon:yes gene_type:complete
MSKHALLKIALMYLVFASLSCGNQEKPVTRQVLNEAQNSVFIVEGLACGKSSVGTGVFIEEGILTNAHVIAGAEKIEVIDFNGNRSTTYPINTDFETDLALLKNPNLAVPSLQIAEPKENQKGSILVGSQGFVESIPVTLLRLLNIVIADIYGEGKHTRSGLELSADVAAGNSGGPIINAKGQVIGLIFSRSTTKNDISYGISSTEFLTVSQDYDLSGVSSGKCRD